MRSLILSAAVTAALCSSTSAQAPFVVEVPSPNADIIAAMSAAGLTINSLGQIEMHDLPASYPGGMGGTPGVFFLISTCDYAGPGSAGGFDALTGIYDTTVSPPTFTRTTEFDAINTVDDEFQVGMTADLLTAVLDLGAGSSAVPSVLTRANTMVDFTTSTPMSGTPGGYIDPHICSVNGQLKVMFVDIPGNIGIGDLDPVSGAVTNVGVVSPLSSQPNTQFNHSPSAIKNGDDSIAMIHSAYIQDPTLGALSDGFFQAHVDDNANTVQAQTIVTSTSPAFVNQYPNTSGSDWIANPDANGGSLTWAIATAGYGDPVQLGIAGMGGGTWPAAGGPVALNAFAPRAAGGLIPEWLCWFAFSTATAAPTPFPPVQGQLGLSLGGATILDQFIVIDPNSGIGTLPLTLPGGLFMAGSTVPFQPIMVNINTSAAYFGNVVEMKIN